MTSTYPVYDIPAGFWPFWFWNGEMDPAEVRRQIDLMAGQGCKGFFIHPRQGLALPYLSEAFFDAVELAVLAAKDRGLLVGLYDEFPYPSGAAGGEVTLGRPELMATRLVQQTRDVPAGPCRWALPAGEVLDIRAWPVRDGRADFDAQPLDLRPQVGMAFGEETYHHGGLTAYNRKRFLATRPAPALQAVLPEGNWRIVASVQCLIEDHKYWGRFPDVLNPAAVERYIELTHERYARRLGEHFGKTLRFVFTDETCANYSALLPEAFRRQHGYDLLPELSVLAEAGHPRHLAVRRDVQKTLEAMYVEAFDKPLARWCREHDLLYVGERTMYSLGQFAHQDIPGCEPGHTRAGAGTVDLFEWTLRGNARAAASASYFYNKPATLVECYHSMGWGATLQDARLIADTLLLGGCEMLIPHGFFYATASLRKHDAPPSFFFQMPYWTHFGQLSRRVDRLAELLAGRRIDADVLLLDPQSLLGNTDDRSACRDLQTQLLAKGIDFMVVDEALLREGRIDDGCLVLRDLRASVVLMPPGPWVDEPLGDWLETFEQAGGTVVRQAGRPTGEVVAEVLSRVCPTLGITPDDDEAKLLASCRTDGASQRWMVVNYAARAVDVEFACGKPLTEVPLDPDVPPRLRQGGPGRCRRRLEPFEAVMLTDEPTEESTAELPEVRVAVGGPAEIRPQGPNLLRLGEWTLCLPGQSAETAAVQPGTLTEQLRRCGLPIRPLIRNDFGTPAEFSLPELTCHYETTFQADFDGSVELLMEPESIRGEARLSLNGRSLDLAAFRPCDVPVPGNLAVDVSDLLQPGPNTLRVEVATGRPDGGLLTPLYLAGPFGVDPAGPKLTPSVREGTFEDYTANGLAYFSGTIDYEMTFRLDDLPEAPELLVRLAFDEPFGEAAEVRFNDGPFRASLWEPRLLRVPAGELQIGENRLALRVRTSLLRAFEAEWFDHRTHTTRLVAQAGD